MNKKILLIFIFLITLAILVVIYLRLSARLCAQAIVYGENIFTGNCKVFSTSCSMPFYYKESKACKFIIEIDFYKLLKGGRVYSMCNELSSEDRQKVFNHFNVNSCEDV